jgi:hypothetical protein
VYFIVRCYKKTENGRRQRAEGRDKPYSLFSLPVFTLTIGKNNLICSEKYYTTVITANIYFKDYCLLMFSFGGVLTIAEVILCPLPSALPTEALA